MTYWFGPGSNPMPPADVPAKPSSKTSWVLSCQETPISPETVQHCTAISHEEKSATNVGEPEREGNNERNSQSRRSSEQGEIRWGSEEREQCRDGKRWGEGIFFHESCGLQGGSGYEATCDDDVERVTGFGSQLGEPCQGCPYCRRDCYSALSFRPKTTALGYRTRTAYARGFGSERLGEMFVCSSCCRERTPCETAMACQSRAAGSSRRSSQNTSAAVAATNTSKKPVGRGTDVNCSAVSASRAASAAKVTTKPSATEAGQKRGEVSQDTRKAGKKAASPAPTPAQLAAAASAKAVVRAAVAKNPNMDECAQSRLYASEFFCKNPCIAYLPWQRVNKKTKKNKQDKESAIKGSSAKQTACNCLCKEMRFCTTPVYNCPCKETQAETSPMMTTSEKFTETDYLMHDQCTWMENNTTDQCVGTELVTYDQFTNVRPEDIDGQLDGDESSFAETFGKVSFAYSRDSARQSFRGSYRESVPPKRFSEARASTRYSILRQSADGRRSSAGGGAVTGGKGVSYSAHSLVNYPTTDTEYPPNPYRGSVPASFAAMGQTYQGPEQAWDGLVCNGGGITCCPPCVVDPCSLSRFWRRTPKFSHVVRATPLCDCCTSMSGQVVGGKSLL